MKFTIEGRLDGLNEYTKVNRENKFGANNCKIKNQKKVILAILKAFSEHSLTWVYKYPIKVRITWYEPNRKRDIDNITFATKFILDALVQKKVIENDSQKFVNKIEHEVLLDKENPRIEVELLENE